MKPTIGRIVIYRYANAVMPAIITAVFGTDTVNLTTFPSGGNPYPVTSVLIDDGEGEQAQNTWRWPERVAS